MSRPKKWPHHAVWARDEAIMELATAIKALRPLLAGGTFTATERVRRQAVALSAIQSAHAALEKVK